MEDIRDILIESFDYNNPRLFREDELIKFLSLYEHQPQHVSEVYEEAYMPECDYFIQTVESVFKVYDRYFKIRYDIDNCHIVISLRGIDEVVPKKVESVIYVYKY